MLIQLCRTTRLIVPFGRLDVCGKAVRLSAVSRESFPLYRSGSREDGGPAGAPIVALRFGVRWALWSGTGVRANKQLTRTPTIIGARKLAISSRNTPFGEISSSYSLRVALQKVVWFHCHAVIRAGQVAALPGMSADKINTPSTMAHKPIHLI